MEKTMAKKRMTKKERMRQRRRRQRMMFGGGLLLVAVVFTVILLLLGSKGCGTSKAEGDEVEAVPSAEATEAPKTEPTPTPEPVPSVDISDINSRSGILVRLSDGKVVAEKDADAKIYPASMTKIMTAVVGLENLTDQNDPITNDRDTYDRLYTEGASLAGFGAGDEVKAIDILYGVMLPSGAECCVGLAQHLFGSEENFVAKMNEKAAELGMDSTHFVTCTGLHDENHYTTVYDIYLMLQEAMTYPHFLEIAQLSSYNLTCNRGEQEVTFHLDATDQYLTRQVTAPKNVTVLGGKTGTTSDAGSCLALLSQNAYGEPYISIVLHAANKTNLYTYMNQLLSAINQ